MSAEHVLIISEGAEFGREIVGRWKREANPPPLTVVSPEVCKDGSPTHSGVAVVGPVRKGTRTLFRLTLPSESNVCAVVESDLLHSVQNRHPDWLLVPELPGWPDALVALIRQIVLRSAAEARACNAEKADLAQKRLAILGGALVDSRPTLVNALTSLLGNADLILLASAPLSAELFEQTRTMHAMALRLSDIVQRLFSLAAEAPRDTSALQWQPGNAPADTRPVVNGDGCRVNEHESTAQS